MTLSGTVTYLDIMASIERLSSPLPDMLDRLAMSFTEIPPLAQKLRWCDIPTGERLAVMQRLRELATGYAEMRTPMAGHISRNLTAASHALELSLRGAPETKLP